MKIQSFFPSPLGAKRRPRHAALRLAGVLRLAPGTPASRAQGWSAPPAPDYAQADAWLARPAGITLKPDDAADFAMFQKPPDIYQVFDYHLCLTTIAVNAGARITAYAAGH